MSGTSRAGPSGARQQRSLGARGWAGRASGAGDGLDGQSGEPTDDRGANRRRLGHTRAYGQRALSTLPRLRG